MTGQRAFLRLLPNERWMLWLIAGVGLLAVALAVGMQRQVNWPPFLAGYFGTLGIAAGLALMGTIRYLG